MIAQRKLRKEVADFERRMKQPVKMGTYMGFLRQIDEQMKRFDSFLTLHQNVVAFLTAKGVISQEEFTTWDEERKKQIAEAKAKEKADGNSDGEVQPDIQPAQTEAE